MSGEQTFLTKNGTSVDLVVSSQSLVTVAFIHGTTDYLYTEANSVDSAWINIPTGVDSWLYWEINSTTGKVHRKVTTLEPIEAPKEPVGSSTGQLWFDTLRRIWAEYNGANYREVIVVFACRVNSGTAFSSMSIDSPLFTGTQVGITDSVRAGSLVYNSHGNAVKSGIGNTFFTTEDEFLTGVPNAAYQKLNNVLLTGEASCPIAAYQIVQFNTFDDVCLANPAISGNRVLGIVDEDVATNDTVTFITEGVIVNDAWDWEGEGANVNDPLYLDLIGELSLKNNFGSRSPIGSVLNKNTIYFSPRLFPQVHLNTSLSSSLSGLTDAQNNQLNAASTQATANQATLASQTTSLINLSSDVASVESDISALTTRITNSETDITDLNTDTTALTTRVTTTEGDISTNASDIITLQSSLTTQISSLTTVTNRVTANEVDILDLISDATALTIRVTDSESDITALTTRVTDNETDITDLTTDVTALTTRVTTAESDITTNASDITAIDTRITTAESNVTTLTTNTNALASRVTTNELDISNIQTGVSSINARVGVNETDITDLTTDATALTTRVTTAEGDITTNETDITALTTRVTTAESDITGLTTNVSGRVSKSGDTMTGLLVLSGPPIVALGASTRQYVDDIDAVLTTAVNARVEKAGSVITGVLDFSTTGADISMNGLSVYDNTEPTISLSDGALLFIDGGTFESDGAGFEFLDTAVELDNDSSLQIYSISGGADERSVDMQIAGFILGGTDTTSTAPYDFDTSSAPQLIFDVDDINAGVVWRDYATQSNNLGRMFVDVSNTNDLIIERDGVIALQLKSGYIEVTEIRAKSGTVPADDDLMLATKDYVDTLITGGPALLDDLLDVTITSRANNEILFYDDIEGDFVNRLITVGDIDDINITSIVDNQILFYDNTTSKFINKLISTDEIEDINITSIANNEVLFYDNTSSKFVNKEIVVNDISEINTSTLLDNHVLIYDDTVSEFKNRMLIKVDISDFDESDYVDVTTNQTVGGIKTFSNDVVISGNLTVTGTQSSVNSTDTEISDNKIEINSGEVGAGVTAGTAGLLVDRGTETNEALLFDDVDDLWKVGPEATLRPIATSYVDTFLVADWTTGSPNTLVITQATHLQPISPIYAVDVFNGTDKVEIQISVNATTGDVTVSTTGATFSGAIRIAL